MILIHCNAHLTISPDGHCDEVLGSGKGMAKREVGAVKAVADPSFWRNSSSGAEGRCPATEP
jgi:hypothetical protein